VLARPRPTLSDLAEYRNIPVAAVSLEPPRPRALRRGVPGAAWFAPDSLIADLVDSAHLPMPLTQGNFTSARRRSRLLPGHGGGGVPLAGGYAVDYTRLILRTRVLVEIAGRPWWLLPRPVLSTRNDAYTRTISKGLTCWTWV
jgi:hypothetical protein